MSVKRKPEYQDYQAQEEPLSKQADQIEQESRMVLPGIQALFGFQLVAVFETPFRVIITPLEQKIHLVSVLLVATAIALVLAPVAYHRQVEPTGVSTVFTRLATLFLTWATVPLMFGLCLDVYLVARIITGSVAISVVIFSALLLGFALVWFIFPRWRAESRGHLSRTHLRK